MARIAQIGLVLIALVAFSAPALAATEQMFNKCDSNKDGTVTLEEYRACRGDQKKAEDEFKWYDRDKNGKVTKKEMLGTM